MTFIVIEGVDRSGKSTLAKKYEEQGYEYIHFKAPDKKYYEPGYTGPSYLDDIISLLVEKSGQNVVFDRSWYGEAFVWPNIYRRIPLLTSEDIEVITEIENNNDVKRILMHDSDVELHWRRCVENNEPLKRTDFNSAVQLYDHMASQYNFNKLTLSDISSMFTSDDEENNQMDGVAEELKQEKTESKEKDQLSPEQQKLQQANVINDVLSSRIIKKKGNSYDAVENKIRFFLKKELADLLGTAQPQDNQFSSDEVKILKALINRVVSKAQ